MPTCWSRYSKARDAGIVVLTNESPGQPSANWDVEIIDNEKFAAEYVEHMAKRMGQRRLRYLCR